MNQLSSLPAEFSTKNQQFCDNLLALAEWLDSQEADNYASHSPVKGTNTVLNPEWEATMNAAKNPEGEYKLYYWHEHTNAERVLAVLMLRAAILAGDSFV